MSNLSFDINDDTLAALLVVADAKNTSLTRLVNTVVTDYLNELNAKEPAIFGGDSSEATATPTSNEGESPSPQELVEAIASGEHKTGCCGEGGETTPSINKSLPLSEMGDLESSSIFNKPIGEKRPPKGAPLYNPRVTNKWL